MGWDGMGWDGMGWGECGVGLDGMGWDGMVVWWCGDGLLLRQYTSLPRHRLPLLLWHNHTIHHLRRFVLRWGGVR